MQTQPDLFVPPAFWGKYPPYGAPQTSTINTRSPRPPVEDGPGPPPLGMAIPTLGVGTIVPYPGAITSPAQLGQPSLDPSGNLILTENRTGKSYKLTPS